MGPHPGGARAGGGWPASAQAREAAAGAGVPLGQYAPADRIRAEAGPEHFGPPPLDDARATIGPSWDSTAMHFTGLGPTALEVLPGGRPGRWLFLEARRGGPRRFGGRFAGAGRYGLGRGVGAR